MEFSGYGFGGIFEKRGLVTSLVTKLVTSSKSLFLLLFLLLFLCKGYRLQVKIERAVEREKSR